MKFKKYKFTAYKKGRICNPTLNCLDTLFWTTFLSPFVHGWEGVKSGKPQWTRSQPSLDPHWNVFGQWMYYVEIQFRLLWDEL